LFLAIALSTLTLVCAVRASADVSEADMFGPIYNDHIRTLAICCGLSPQDLLGGTDYLTVMAKQGSAFSALRGLVMIFCRRGRGRPRILGAQLLGVALPADCRMAWSLKLAAAAQFAAPALLLSQQFLSLAALRSAEPMNSARK